MTVSLSFEDSQLTQDLPKDKTHHVWAESVKELHGSRLSSLKIDDEKLTVQSVAIIVGLAQRHASTLTHLYIRRCTGALDMLLAPILISSTSQVEIVTLGFACQQDHSLLERCFQVLGIALAIYSSRLKELDIRLAYPLRQSYRLSVESAIAFAQALESTTTLERLVLQQCSFSGPSAIQALADGFAKNSTLQSLEFWRLSSSSGGALEDSDIATLLQGLTKNKKPPLRQLRISECQCLSQTMLAIVNLIPTLHELRIINSIYSPTNRMDLSVLISSLVQTKTLHTIEFYNCGLQDDQMSYIAKVLEYNDSSIKRLELAFNYDITSYGVFTLASNAKKWKSLQHLDLFACGSCCHNNRNDDSNKNAMDKVIKEWIDVIQNHNLTLQTILLEAHYYRKHPKLLYYLNLNAVGRKLLVKKNDGSRMAERQDFPPGLWAHVLARANRNQCSRNADALYYFLGQLPHLVMRGDGA